MAVKSLLYRQQPATHAVAVTTHDTNLLANEALKGLYVGVSGDVKVTTVDGEDITFKAAPVGILPIQAKRVFATGTTATDIVALY